MHDRLVGHPLYEGTNHIGVLHIGEVIALLGEAADVLAESLTCLLPTNPQVPGIPWAHVGALEVANEDVFVATPGVDPTYRQVLDPGVGAINEVEGKVLDDEELIIGSTCQACHAVVLELDTGRFDRGRNCAGNGAWRMLFPNTVCATRGSGCDRHRASVPPVTVLPSIGVGELCLLALAIPSVDDVAGIEVAPSQLCTRGKPHGSWWWVR
jgi:hypothetical protein